MSKGKQFTSWKKEKVCFHWYILWFPDEMTASMQGDTRPQPLVYFVSRFLPFYAPVEERC